MDSPASTPASGESPAPGPSASSEHQPLVMTGSYREIVALTAPLVLSSTGLMLMHFMDAVFLAWHSKESIAIVGPAGIAAYCTISLFIGIASYTGTFVSQYLGARQPQRAAKAAWQGIYVALIAGLVIAALASLIARPLFNWVGHAPELRELEARFYEICCWGAPASLLGVALSGFFSGQGANKTLMAVQLSGFVLNGFLSYGMIFGVFGLPRWGSSGAAAASALAQTFDALALLVLFFIPRYRKPFGTWVNRGLDWPLCKRMLHYGSYNGLRAVAELTAWTVFLFFIGRVGENEMAITNMAWRINTVAFIPLFGLSTAVLTLVGHAQGRGDPAQAAKITWRGTVVAEIWMLLGAVLFLSIPRAMFSLFHDPANESFANFDQLVEVGVVLLRFVSLYCVLDGVNVVVLGALQGAGDVRWTLWASVSMHVAFLAALALIDHLKLGLYPLWTAATAFVMFQALVWLWRFYSGAWRTMRVIEQSPSFKQ